LDLLVECIRAKGKKRPELQTIQLAVLKLGGHL
jgi:hypothetical protein